MNYEQHQSSANDSLDFFVPRPRIHEIEKQLLRDRIALQARYIEMLENDNRSNGVFPEEKRGEDELSVFLSRSFEREEELLRIIKELEWFLEEDGIEKLSLIRFTDSEDRWFEFDTKRSVIISDDSFETPIPSQEGRVLHSLLLNPGAVVSKEQINWLAWKRMFLPEIDDGNLRSHVCILRKQLREVSSAFTKSIETIHGRGFRYNGRTEVLGQEVTVSLDGNSTVVLYSVD